MDSLRYTHSSCGHNQQPDYSATFSACWIFSCFRNPPISDIDYNILNVHTRSFLCVRITRGLGTLTASQHVIFDLKKTGHFFLALLMGFELGSLGSWNLESDALPF